MYIDWTKHLKTDEEKQDFSRQVIAAKPVIDRIRTLVKERTDAVEAREYSIKDFDTPSWAEKQAFQNGFKALAQIINRLTDLDQQRDPNVRQPEHFIG